MTLEAKKNRLGFETFMKGKLPIGDDSAKYVRSLDSKIKAFYKNKLHKVIDSVYEITEENSIYRIKQDIVANPGLVYQRGRNGDSRIEGLDLYISYLKSLLTQSSVAVPKRRTKLASAVMEGRHIAREQVVIQRNQEARKKCIEHFGCKCAACGLVMSDKYGEIGKGFIEVHHLNPIHLFDDAHLVDYRTDLIPLCPNCHAMIHKLEDPGDLEGLRRILEDCRITNN